MLSKRNSTVVNFEANHTNKNQGQPMFYNSCGWFSLSISHEGCKREAFLSHCDAAVSLHNKGSL